MSLLPKRKVTAELEREVLRLFDEHRLSTSSIARIIDLSQPTVRRVLDEQLRKRRLMLRKSFRAKYRTSFHSEGQN